MSDASAPPGPPLPGPASAGWPAGFADLFKIGLGPSSSHTVGPMRAAMAFAEGLAGLSVARLQATAYGSLAWTGKGHGTDKAIALGLTGARPDEIDPAEAERLWREIGETRTLILPSGAAIPFHPDADIHLDKRTHVPRHPNALSLAAVSPAGVTVAEELYYSVGGGFIEREGDDSVPATPIPDPAHRWISAEGMLKAAEASGLTVAEMALANEDRFRPRAQTLALVDRIADEMLACIDRGLTAQGMLPGGLRVRRRARALTEGMDQASGMNMQPADAAMRRVASWAIAVNEENAAGGRVVTAPTNGAAGVIPATLRYAREFCPLVDREGPRRFLLSAAAIGGIVKRNASISGAEVGCQGEVGTAAAMAAAGLAAAQGGTPAQVEHAAEIALEHHLGMTCDPVAGLVQIPCIERNAFGATKAILAASLALQGDGQHRVTLDQVVETMRQTGLDMNEKYRETSRGGLAVNVPEC